MLEWMYISEILAKWPEVHFCTILNGDHLDLYNIVNISPLQLC